MKKTVVAPGRGEVESDAIDEPISAYCVLTHHETHRRVIFSGGLWPEGGLDEQVRTVLTYVEQTLEDLDGSMDDVLSLTFYVLADELSPEVQGQIHEVRSEFFERPHYPASTMIGVADLLHDGGLVEIDVEAEIPNDGWETDVLEPEET